MKKLPVICPSCEESLAVSQLSCSNCETIISGNYTLPILLQLSQDEQEFLFDFILMGGSLKKLASKMEKSYPTVRNKLDDIIEKMNQLKTDRI